VSRSWTKVVAVPLHDPRAPASAGLPSGYRALRELGRRPDGLVLLARRGGSGEEPGEEVVLRLAPRAADAEQRAELAVLARVAAPGLARLVDFGSVAAGGAGYVARTWIPGRDLRAWARERDARAIGEVVARLCPALEHLHRAGFVHADLKAENVIVGADGAPVLTDFGLARRESEGATAGGAAGTLYSIAPEVLLGEPPDARSDLFALGVMLHELLVGERAPASEFYAAFPARPFFEATRTSAEDLPEWARDVVARLVERDPARRPASALEVARTLRERLGLPDDPRLEQGRICLQRPVLEGRERWLESWLAEVRAERDGAAARPRPRALVLPPGEDPARILSELRLWLALRGEPALRVDLSAELSAVRDGLALDRFASACRERAPQGFLLLVVPEDDAWCARAADHVARALLRAPGAATPVRTARSAVDADLWAAAELPPVAQDELEAFLARELEGDVGAFAAWLAEEGGGAAARVSDLLQHAVESGCVVPGDRRPRVRSVPRPGAAALPPASDEALRAAGGDAVLLLAALRVLGGEAAPGEIERLLRLAPGTLADAFGRALAAGLVRARRAAGGLRLRAAVDAPVDAPRLRELHARRAAELTARAATAAEILPHRFAARPDERAMRAVVEESRRLSDLGCPELALELARRVARLAREAGVDPRPALAEEASSRVALGEPELAASLCQQLDQAAAERVRGLVAQLRQDYDAAREHFERALALAPDEGGEALWNRARVLFETRCDDELDALTDAVERGAHPELGPRRAWSLVMLRAMSLLRRGRVERARDILGAELAAALEAGDVEREAAVRLNLGTLERRTTDLRSACEHFERAAQVHEGRGYLPGVAQARALLGGSMRERGELLAAEPLLLSALDLRERLGDRAGARAVRGMLGLLYADRGWLRAGLDELSDSARHLRDSGRSIEAAVLAARAEELAARLGKLAPTRATSEAERTLEADPRILVSLARAAWTAGDRDAARDYAARALALSERLGLRVPADEARLLAAWLEAQPPAPLALESESAREDDELLRALVAGPAEFDPAAAMRRALRLGDKGRDDRAARLALAVAARAADDELAAAALTRAGEWLGSCAAGLSAEEERAMRRTLLGLADPHPDDLERAEHRARSEEGLDMDLISLLDINRRLVAEEDLAPLLRTIVESALDVTGAERGFLVLEEEGEIALDTARDSRHGDIAEPELEISRTVVQRALDSGAVLRLSNALDDPLLGGAPSVAELDLRSILCAPFAVAGGVRGAIYVDHRLREGAFSERAERLLGLLAGQAALAIRQVRRIEEIRRLNGELNRKVVARESDLKNARRALEEAGAVVPASGLIGASPAMQRVHRLIERYATSALPVIVCGASGTGKELAARALHELSARKGGPFVAENCAALPPTLIEAELFGYQKGAFTGADKERAGMFERADGGTLFLDEIGELPLELQAKLLRVLETGEIRRLGGSRTLTSDFRLVAATNRDLALEVRAGRFREDLVYRLDALRVDLPPLSARVEDIPALVDHFVRLEALGDGVERRVSKGVLSALCRRAWPGNVRELANEIARMCVMSEGDLDDPGLIRAPGATAAQAEVGGVLPFSEVERRAILGALEHTGGDKRRAAELLGISRAKVYQRLKEWGEG